MAFATAVIWTLFGLLSGAGDGLDGIIANLPNALPGLLLLVTSLIALRWELVGGLLLVVMGAASIGFFHAWTALLILVGFCLPILAAGAGLTLSHILDRADRRQ